MALDQVLIGERIRKAREKVLNESRKSLAQKCGFEERYIAQVERGEFLIPLRKLDIIATVTGISTDYFLYGIGETANSTIKQALHNIIDNLDEDEAIAYYKCISIMKKVKKKDR